MQAVQARTLASAEEFSRQLDEAMRIAYAMRLLPDPETAMAQHTPAENSHKRRYGDEQGKAHVNCLVRLAID